MKPLGAYMAAVFRGERTFLSPLLGPVERLIYRISGVDPAHESDWTRYAFDALLVNLLGFIAVYALQRLQGVLPLNPQGLGAIPPDSSFNTAVSFATNTNWQGYVGEATLSYLTQMLGLAVQNFLSAATGIAVLIALIRGFVRREAGQIGNFWVDFTRSTLHVLLPLSFILAVVLASQGVVQSFAPYQQVTLVEPVVMQEQTVTEQTLPLGPAASQVAIKQLGTNGGGFFNVNSAHPFENPTPLSNFLEMLAILLIPAALCYTFGRMAIDQARLMVLNAAWKLDVGGSANAISEVSAIKVVVPNMAQQVIDFAIQLHGGGGVSSDFPLAAAWTGARTLRLADGPDEVHRGVVARIELGKYR